MKRLILILVAVIFAIVAVVALVSWWSSAPEADRVHVDDARIAEVKSMVQLASLDMYEEIPIKASIGNRHIIARQRLEGSVNFDLENLEMTQKGDTLMVVLPREIVTVRESDTPGSYEVVDTWNDKFLGSDHFTTAEENGIKKRAMDNYVKSLYAKGVIREARRTARENVKNLLGPVTGKTVIVIDPMPSGQYQAPSVFEQRGQSPAMM